MNKQPAVTEQTRANLREAFWSLYLEKPIEKITIREITDRAGYNRATFYLYFRDVYDLFGQIEDEILEGVRRLVNEEILRDRTLDISQHMGRIIQLAQRNGYAVPQLMGPHGDPGFSQRLKAILAPLFDQFILDGQDLTDQQRAIMREFYASGLLAAIGTWMTLPEPMPIDRLVEMLVSTLLAR